MSNAVFLDVESLVPGSLRNLDCVSRRVVRLFAAVFLSVAYSCVPTCAQQVKANELQKAVAEVQSTKTTSTAAIDQTEFRLQLSPTAPESTIETLARLLEPRLVHVATEKTVAQIMVEQYGSVRDSLVPEIVQLNPRQFHQTDNAPTSATIIPANTDLRIPDIPLRSHDVWVPVEQGTNTEPIVKFYYGTLHGTNLGNETNKKLDRWDARESGTLVFPNVPEARVVALKSADVVTSQLNVTDATGIQAAAYSIAYIRKLPGVSSFLLPTNAELEQSYQLASVGDQQSSEGNAEGTRCEDLVSQSQLSPEWYLNDIGVSRLSLEDLDLQNIVTLAVVDSGIVQDAELFRGILVTVSPSESSFQAPLDVPRVGIDTTHIASDFPADNNKFKHGTHVSSIATGILMDSSLRKAWANRLNLLVIKMFDKEDTGETKRVHDFFLRSEGLYPVVYNMSFRAPLTDEMQEPFQKESDMHLFVIAAGNNKLNIDAYSNFFPAVLGPENRDLGKMWDRTMIVAATDNSGALWSQSNKSNLKDYSKQKIEIAAPGMCIRGRVHAGTPSDYEFLSGTSQAAPLVSFTAALLFSKHRDLGAMFVKERILCSCDWDPKLAADVANGCKLNVAKALATRVDLVELKGSPSDRALLRGHIKEDAYLTAADNEILYVGARRKVQLRRIWFGDDGEPGAATVLEGRGKRSIQVTEDSRLRLKMTDPVKCPSEYLSGSECVIPVNKIRDIVFKSYAVVNRTR